MSWDATPTLSFGRIAWSGLLMCIHVLNDKQCGSGSVGFFGGRLIWICTVRKGGIYPGSAGLGLIISKWLLTDVCSFGIAEQKYWETFEINLCNPWLIQMFSIITIEGWSEILVLARFLYTLDWLQQFMNELALLCTWSVLIDQVDLSP